MLPDPNRYPEVYEHLLAKRFLAWVVDLVVTLLLVLVVLVLTAFLSVFILPVIWAAVAVAYRTVALTRWGGTPGMLLAGIRLRRLDGGWPDQSLAFWHSAGYAAQMSFVVPQIASVALILTTPYRQGLNDWILGTTIVNRFLQT